jgi:hypothetical protein
VLPFAGGGTCWSSRTARRLRGALIVADGVPRCFAAVVNRAGPVRSPGPPVRSFINAALAERMNPGWMQPEFSPS